MDKNEIQEEIGLLCKMQAIGLLYADMDRVENAIDKMDHDEFYSIVALKALEKFARDYNRFGQFLEKVDCVELREKYEMFYRQLEVGFEFDSESLTQLKKNCANPFRRKNSVKKEDGTTVR